jgi:hypothetical protein
MEIPNTTTYTNPEVKKNAGLNTFTLDTTIEPAKHGAINAGTSFAMFFQK